MAASTKAYFLYPPSPGLGAGHVNPPSGGLHPENSPAWLWGQGTPAAIAPFTTVNKGSIYSEVNASDDDPHLWFKVDEGGDTADWVSIGNTGVVVVKSELFDISATDSGQVVFNAVTACEVLEAGILWNEASAASGLEGGDVTIGTTTGGAELVAATAYGTSKSTGTYDALVLKAAGVELAAAASVFVSHDIASGAAGTYFLQMKIRVEV